MSKMPNTIILSDTIVRVPNSAAFKKYRGHPTIHFHGLTFILFKQDGCQDDISVYAYGEHTAKALGCQQKDFRGHVYIYEKKAEIGYIKHGVMKHVHLTYTMDKSTKKWLNTKA